MIGRDANSDRNILLRHLLKSVPKITLPDGFTLADVEPHFDKINIPALVKEIRESDSANLVYLKPRNKLPPLPKKSDSQSPLPSVPSLTKFNISDEVILGEVDSLDDFLSVSGEKTTTGIDVVIPKEKLTNVRWTFSR